MSEHHMVPYTYDGTYVPATSNGESCACETLVNMALVGAVVGGSAAAARNAARMKRDEIDLGEALVSTGRTALASAAATAVAGAAASAVAGHGALRLAVMFGVGAGVLYGLNRWSEGKEEGDA
jgi:hypothetical protein